MDSEIEIIASQSNVGLLRKLKNNTINSRGFVKCGYLKLHEWLISRKNHHQLNCGKGNKTLQQFLS